MALGIEYETSIAKISNKVKAIISTQLWNFWGGSKVASRKFMLAKFIIEESNQIWITRAHVIKLLVRGKS